jgi:hypothetical protein
MSCRDLSSTRIKNFQNKSIKSSLTCKMTWNWQRLESYKVKLGLGSWDLKKKEEKVRVNDFCTLFQLSSSSVDQVLNFRFLWSVKLFRSYCSEYFTSPSDDNRIIPV